jgi:hypothetical protein
MSKAQFNHGIAGDMGELDLDLENPRNRSMENRNRASSKTLSLSEQFFLDLTHAGLAERLANFNMPVDQVVSFLSSVPARLSEVFGFWRAIGAIYTCQGILRFSDQI